MNKVVKYVRVPVKNQKEILEEQQKELMQYAEEKGFEVVDTVFEKGPDNPLYFLSKSIEAMSNVDAVVFMPGWQGARGCRIEHQVAAEYGKFIKYL